MTDIKSFWNNCHDKELKESICGFYENGVYYTTYVKTIDFLKLKDYIKPGLKVLEIGVGLGIVTKALHDGGLIVSGLDISDIALNKVKEYCENIFTTDELEKLPSNYFDVILCNRVIQHVPTEDLIKELQHCIRSLKIDGIFAIQFVSGDVPDYAGGVSSLDGVRAGIFCRTPEYLKEVIEKLGGTCELIFSVSEVSGPVRESHVIHVRRVDYE